MCTLETKIKKSVLVKRKTTAMRTPDTQIAFVKAPYIQYEQFLMTKTFRQYLETILISSKALKMGIQKTATIVRMKCKLALSSLQLISYAQTDNLTVLKSG